MIWFRCVLFRFANYSKPYPVRNMLLPLVCAFPGQVSVVSRIELSIDNVYWLHHIDCTVTASTNISNYFCTLWPKRRSYYERRGDFAKFTTQILQIISIFPFRKLQIFISFRFVSQITVGLGNDVYQCVSLQISCDKNSWKCTLI